MSRNKRNIKVESDTDEEEEVEVKPTKSKRTTKKKAEEKPKKKTSSIRVESDLDEDEEVEEVKKIPKKSSTKSKKKVESDEEEEELRSPKIKKEIASDRTNSPAARRADISVRVSSPSRKTTKSKKNTEFSLETVDIRSTNAQREEIKEDNIRWAQDLMNFISTLDMILIFNNKEYKKIYDFMTRDERAISIWAKAFTHLSYDPNKDSNYEMLEYSGDKALKHVFTKYLREKFPTYNQAELTSLENYYMSAEGQAEMSKNSGLIDYMRISEFGKQNYADKIAGDIFEAFFGAVEAIGTLYNPAIGAVLCYKVLQKFMANVQLDLNIKYGPATTQVRQIFSRMFIFSKRYSRYERLGTPDVLKDRGRVVISLKKKQVDFLREHGKSVPTILASVSGNEEYYNATVAAANAVKADVKRTKDLYKAYYKLVERNAFREALKTLNRNGIDTPWSIEISRQLDFNREDIQEEINAALLQRNKEGYVDWYFATLSKLDEEGTDLIQLLGVASNGRKYILGQITVKSMIMGGDHMAAKDTIIKSYANGVKLNYE